MDVHLGARRDGDPEAADDSRALVVEKRDRLARCDGAHVCVAAGAIPGAFVHGAPVVTQR